MDEIEPMGQEPKTGDEGDGQERPREIANNEQEIQESEVDIEVIEARVRAAEPYLQQAIVRGSNLGLFKGDVGAKIDLINSISAEDSELNYLYRKYYDLTGAISRGRMPSLLEGEELIDVAKRLLSVLPDEQLQRSLQKPDLFFFGESEEESFSDYESIFFESIIGPMTSKYESLPKLTGNTSRPDLIIDEALKLRYAIEADKRDFRKDLIEVERIKIEASRMEGCDKRTIDLESHEIGRHLQFRESILQKLRIGFGKPENSVTKGFWGEGDPYSIISPFSEQEITHAAFLLSPQLTTSQFIDFIQGVIEAAPNEGAPTDEEAIEWGQTTFYPENKERTFMTHVRKLSFCYKGCTVLEIGGSSFLKTAETMGAKCLAADAGHSDYSISYSAGDRSDMIELSNYSFAVEPHSNDLIVSSRLFDAGSGIEKIADTAGNIAEREKLAEGEMTLVMANLLKNGGFMIHYDGSPIRSIMEKIGIEEVYSTATGAIIYRLNQSKGDPSFKEMRLGRKKAVYKDDSQTWELAA